MSMYLVSNEELNTLVRRRRLDVLDWVRAVADEDGADEQLIETLLERVESHVRGDNIAYDYQEQEESPISEDEFAALEEDDGEDDTAIDFALAHVDDDDTLSMLDTASDGVEVTAVEDDDASTVDGVHVGPYPEFPSQHTEVAEYTAEDEPAAEPEVVAEPAPVAPALSEEERNKRNAARQRILNREIAQIDADR